MKTVFLMLAAVAAVSTYATPKSVTTVTIKGELARLLVNTGAEFSATDAGMGHIWMSATQVVCVKKVTATDGMIYCSLMNSQNNVVTLSSVDGSEAPSQLRRILKEATGSEVRNDDETRTLNVKEISCEISSLGHELDSIDYEPSSTCTITY